MPRSHADETVTLLTSASELPKAAFEPSLGLPDAADTKTDANAIEADTCQPHRDWTHMGKSFGKSGNAAVYHTRRPDLQLRLVRPVLLQTGIARAISFSESNRA